MQVVKKSDVPLLDAIDGETGFVVGSLHGDELAQLRSFISDQYLTRILSQEPLHAAKFYARSICDYHQLSHLLEHQKLWPKCARTLGPAAVASIKQMDFFKRVAQNLGVERISGEDGSGWEEVYWRLVRPGQSDIGSLHADKWFWDLGHGVTPASMRRIKIWIAIHAVPGLSGLRLIPGSHLKSDWLYHGEIDITGKRKPKFKEDTSNLNIVNVSASPGDFVLFHDQLIHGGMPNMSSESRVSLEATLFVRE